MTKEAAHSIAPSSKPSKRVRSRSIYEGLRGGLGSRPSFTDDSWPPTGNKNDADDTSSQHRGRYEDLFIAQPPPVGMQAFVLPDIPHPLDAEGVDTADRPTACAKISCDAGITLGFLAETAQSLLASTKYAAEQDARVVFKTIISFCSDQPAIRKRGVARSVTMIG